MNTTRTIQPEPLLWLRDDRGIYIPRDFANSFANRGACVQGVSQEQWEILEAGPDHEWYWEVWNEVEQDAKITDIETGVVYSVYQDGDCWLIPEGMEWSDNDEFFVGPANGDDDNDSVD